jgi:hypothetical protein
MIEIQKRDGGWHPAQVIRYDNDTKRFRIRDLGDSHTQMISAVEDGTGLTWRLPLAGEIPRD